MSAAGLRIPQRPWIDAGDLPQATPAWFIVGTGGIAGTLGKDCRWRT